MAKWKSELVIGIVEPIGTQGGTLGKSLRVSLADLGIQSTSIKVIDQRKRFATLPDLPDESWENEEERYRTLINYGDALCEKLQSPDLFATLSILAIQEARAYRRKIENQTRARSRHAYILRSFKRPEAIRTLRSVYGDSFLLLGAVSSIETRRRRLAKKLAGSDLAFRSGPHRAAAENLIHRDQRETGRIHGQNVRDTFPMADAFIDASDRRSMDRSLARFLAAWFSYQFHTPTKDEYGMAMASQAGLRSSSLSRQVGAAIATPDGSVLTLGTNDAPRASGGQYWCDEEPDGRDFRLQHDISFELRRRVLADLLDRLAEEGWLESDIKERVGADAHGMAEKARLDTSVGEARLFSALEYGRSVHAEMAALMDAARLGIRTTGCTLYTTTFPCHECARHIVASGIERVVYVTPYPKSLAPELFDDSISIDGAVEPQAPPKVQFEQFIGVSPARYQALFTMGQRKRSKREPGKPVRWVKKSCEPRFHSPPREYIDREAAQLSTFSKKLDKAGVSIRE